MDPIFQNVVANHAWGRLVKCFLYMLHRFGFSYLAIHLRYELKPDDEQFDIEHLRLVHSTKQIIESTHRAQPPSGPHVNELTNQQIRPITIRR